MSLERFVLAQDPQLADIEAELRAGRKLSHWMWYVFPQLAGLGRSATAQHYALSDEAEARLYLSHPVLGPRLHHHVSLVLQCGRSISDIFGSPDDMKFKSSMTLFDYVCPHSRFDEALAKCCAGKRDPLTLRLLAAPG